MAFLIRLKLNDTSYQRRGKWDEKQYYKLDNELLDKYIAQLELDLERKHDITIEELNDKLVVHIVKKYITEEDY